MSGGSEEHFSLQWNDFHSNLSEGFHALLKLEDLVDVTLAADNKYVQAHRLVLSVCSPYFKDLFRVNPCKHPTVILKGVGFQELVDILEFMYRGQVNVKQDSLSDFLKTAEMLQVKGLCENENSTKPSLSAPSSNPPPSAQAIKSGTQCVDRKPILRDTPATWSDDVSQPPLKRKRHVPPVQVPFVPSRVEDEPIVVSKPYEDDTSDEVEFVDVVKPKIEVSDDEKSNIEEGEINENRKSSFSNVFNETDDFAMQNASDSQFDPDFPCSSQNMVGVQSNDQGPFSLVRSPRGNQQLIYNGFVFGIDRVGADRFFWKCSDYHKSIPKFVLSAQGKCQLVYEGFLYCLDHAVKSRAFWRCTDFSKHRCQARVVTVAGEVTKRPRVSHTHGSHDDKIEKRLLWEQMKDAFMMEKLT